MKRIITKVLINTIAILMMATGPILMILPGPQVISWLGLLIFIYNNLWIINRFIYKMPLSVQYFFYWLFFRIDKFKNHRALSKTKTYYI